MSFHG